MGKWVEFRVEIDIDNDLVGYFYDGDEIYSDASWRNEIAPGGQPRIEALDLYGDEPGGSIFVPHSGQMPDVLPVRL